jgi:predicted dehydrogenase
MAAAAAGEARLMAASDKVRIGMIGCGGISVADANAFLAHPESEIVAICDVDANNMETQAKRIAGLRGKRPDGYEDYRRVIERKDVDVVLVCTPDHWHALPTIEACQAGKDVYTEKPLATTIAEGRAMRDAARRYNRVVQMGTHWRSGEHYKEAVEFVQSGKLGKIRQVRCWAYLDWVKDAGNPSDGAPPKGVNYDFWLGPAPKHVFNPNRFHFNFRWFWDYAGGLMTDWGVHLINIALWAMGPEEPRSVFSSGGKRVLTDNTETPDTQIAVYDFPSYSLIWEHQVGCGLGPDRREHGVMWTGTEGSLLVDMSGWEVISEPKKRLETWKHGVSTTEKVRANHARNLLDCVKSRQQPVENLEVGHRVSTTAHLGNLALRSRSLIEWDAKAERVTNNPSANDLVMRAYRAPWRLPEMSS